MEAEFIINFFVYLAITAMLEFYYFKYREDKRINSIMKEVAFLGLSALIIAVFSFLWLFEILNYNPSDFLLIFSLISFIQGIILFMIIYKISNRNKNLFYFLGFYLFTFIAVLLVHISFMQIFVEVHFLFILLISIALFSREDDYRNIGIFGMSYSGLSLLLQVLVLAGVGQLYFFSIFYGALFLGFMIFFFDYIKDKPLSLSSVSKKQKSYFFHFLRSFVFIVALINLVFIGTVVIHEFGHLMVSYLYQCASRQIVYSAGFPDTQILCSNLTSTLYVTLGGILAPVIIGIILFFIGGRFLREIGILMVGFNMIIASGDYLNLGLSSNLAFFIVIIGVLISIIGIISLAKSKSEDYIYSLEHFF